MNCDIVDTGIHSASWIMQKDQDLLNSLELSKKPILHLYEWEGPSATYGHFLHPEEFFTQEALAGKMISLAKRPTGGGIIFHLWDFAFSVLIPASHSLFSQNTLENYQTVNRCVLSSAEEFLHQTGCSLTPEDGISCGKSKHFCMAKPTKYDVMLQGKKIAGAAQRKTKSGLLHQGSISLCLPSKDFLLSVLQPDMSVIDSMFSHTFPLLGHKASIEDLIKGKKQIKELLIKHITKDFSL
jgi:lipoate---protein ligase